MVKKLYLVSLIMLVMVLIVSCAPKPLAADISDAFEIIKKVNEKYENMQSFNAIKTTKQQSYIITAIEDVWGPYYAARAQAVVDGTWASTDTWHGMAEGMVVMSPYNAKLMSADLIQEAINMEIAIKDGTLHSFAGPIYNQAGELVVPEGQNADDGMLAGMDFYVQGIDDELPQ